MSHILCPIAIFLGVAFIVIGSWPTKPLVNRRVRGALPPPLPECERRYVP